MGGVVLLGGDGCGAGECYLRAEKRRNSRIYIEVVDGDGRSAPTACERQRESERVVIVCYTAKCYYCQCHAAWRNGREKADKSGKEVG